MHEVQKQLHDYILDCVMDRKKRDAKTLLAEVFKEHSERTFDAVELKAFNEMLLTMIKPQYYDEVRNILSKHGKEQISD